MYTLGSLLEFSSINYPGRPALLCPEKGIKWTYGEWNKHVNRLANAFLALGVAKGDRISTFLPNCGELVAVLFAAAKLGAVFNPINYNLSPGELAFILNDAEAKVLVFGRDEKKRVDKVRDRIKTVEHYVYTDPDRPGFAHCYHQLQGGYSSAGPDTRVSENDWYSIIYTSGTTGKPKGVIHRHRDIMDHNMAMLQSQRLNHHDRGLSVAPLYHAAELHCFFLPRVHVGATNVIMKDFHVGKVMEVLQDEDITVMFADPFKWKMIVQDPAAGSFDLPRFRLLAYGGAPMPGPVVTRCREIFDADIIHYYGMTEMGPGISVLYPGEPKEKQGSAGKALINHEIRVVKFNPSYPSDPCDTVETGARGEIIVRGTGMMQGYYNRPEMTARALYGGWYHTGDVGSFDSEGYLWVYDRLDDGFIVGVDNVYPREIEEVLLECPGIQEAAVVGAPGKEGEPRIIAFLVSNKNISVQEVDGFLRRSDKLADFKIPHRYRFVEHLPKLTTGKISRQNLLKYCKVGD